MAKSEGFDNKKTRFWDILLVRENGEWLGVRAPWELLQRVATYFAVLLLLAAVSITGWISSRWSAQRLRENLSQETLKSASLEAQIQELKKQFQNPIGAYVSTGSPQMSLLPSLDRDDYTSNVMGVDSFVTEFDPKTFDLSVKFDLNRIENSVRGNAFYWVLLLHSPSGILSFPPAINSQNGEVIFPHRGQAIEAMQNKRSVLARYKVRGFIENAGLDPVYATLNVYDSKGSLLLRRRSDLNLKRARVNGAEVVR